MFIIWSRLNFSAVRLTTPKGEGRDGETAVNPSPSERGPDT